MANPQSPLRVCLVLPYALSESGGGVKHHVFELAKALRDLGDEVQIIGPSNAPVPGTPGVTAFKGVVHVHSNGGDNQLGLLVSPLQVSRYFRENRFDVIHLHEPPVPALTYWTSWLTKDVPKIATFHAFAEAPSHAKQMLQALAGFLLSGFSDHAIAVSPPAARYAKPSWSRSFAIVPNGVNTDCFYPPVQEPPPGAPVRLFFLGRAADERKGLRFLLEAYRELKERGVNVTLDLAGEGTLAHAGTLPGLTCHGPVKRDQLVELYQSCDVFVAPSTGQESFGMVLTEAMACGRAIVCGAIEGYQYAADPQGAVFVPPGDVDALAKAIEELAGQPERRRQMGGFNLEHVRKYSWPEVAKAVRQEYLVAIEKRASHQSFPWGKLARGAVTAAFAVALALFVRTLHLKETGAALARANPWSVGLAVGLTFAIAVGRALYTKLLLAPVKRLRLWPLWRLSIAGTAAGLLAPARAGDAFRVWQLRKQAELPVPIALGLLALEKVYDVLGILLICAPLPWLVPGLPPPLRLAMFALPVVVALVLVAAKVLLKNPKLRGAPWLAGLSLLEDRGAVALAFGGILFATLLDATQIGVLMAALGVFHGIGGPLLVLLSVNVAIVVPVSPGNAGTHELGSILALRLLGVSSATAAAVALAYHAAQVLPPLVAGYFDAAGALAGRRTMGFASLEATAPAKV
jgi:phosphatidylinositol alpha-mannosyltransferase